MWGKDTKQVRIEWGGHQQSDSVLCKHFDSPQKATQNLDVDGEELRK